MRGVLDHYRFQFEPLGRSALLRAQGGMMIEDLEHEWVLASDDLIQYGASTGSHGLNALLFEFAKIGQTLFFAHEV